MHTVLSSAPESRIVEIGKWRENFGEEEKEVIQKIMGETLKKLGYE